MKTKTHSPILATLAALALVASAHGQLFIDDFESYTPDTTLTTSGPWGSVSISNANLIVRDESMATPFGEPNQYFEWDDDNGTSSPKALSANIAAASGAVTTFAFDFYEPSGGGDGSLIFGYAMEDGDLTSSTTAGRRLSMNLDDGAITGLSSSPNNTYSLDTAYRVYVVFNDTAAAVSYNGGSNSVAAGSADVWLHPIGAAPVLAGTRSAFNSQTPSYRVGFRSFSATVQRVLIDDVSLEAGVALPDGTPPALDSTDPGDGAIDVTVNSDLVATFDESIIRGTGLITLKKTMGDVTVGTFDVANPAEVSLAGSSFSIDPAAPLEIGTDYHVLIAANTVLNKTGVAFPAISTTTDWNFTTSSDGTPPTLLTKTPGDGTSGVALDADLIATFDEAIAVGSGNIIITNLTESTIFATIDVTDATQVDATGSTLTIDPTADLREGRSYAVEIEEGAVTDTATNPYAGISGTSDWDFATVADTTDPLLTSTSPADDASNVSLTANLSATFDEPILAGAGNIVVKNLTDSTSFAPIPVGDAQVSISGSELTIDPTADLAAGKEYAVQIDAGAVTDLSGNSYAGIVAPDVSTWNFTTTFLNSKDSIVVEAQSTPVENYYPNAAQDIIGVGGSSGFRTDRNLVLGYILPTLPAGETAGTVDFFFEITLARDSTGAANLPGLQVYLLDTADPDSSGSTFAYQGDGPPPANSKLVDTTSVTIVGTGDNGFADDEEDRVFSLSGDALALFQSFYGGDHMPDQAEVFFRFNLDEKPSINHFRRYRIDLGNSESGLDIVSVPATPPALASTLPADDATAVAEDTNLVATFDQPIQEGTGNITIRNVTDSTTFATIDVTDGTQVSISGTDLTIDPAAPLDSGKQYAIQLDAGVIEDVTGQAFAGIADPDVTSWNFFTTTFSLAPSSKDFIVGRRQSNANALGYYVDVSSGLTGVTGSSASQTREDRNYVLGFTLPTLAPGETINGAKLLFEVTAARDQANLDPELDVYLLDYVDPSTTGDSLFIHAETDPNPNVELAGSIYIAVGTSTTTYADDEQDQTITIGGDALALLQSFYGGDRIPDQPEAFFRFNMDKLVSNIGTTALLRYIMDTAPDEASLEISTTGGTTTPYDTWAGANGLTGGDALPTANPDGDTLINLLEFAFGTDPGASTGDLLVSSGTITQPGGPTVWVDPASQRVYLRYSRRADYASVVLGYTEEFSPDDMVFETGDDEPDGTISVIGTGTGAGGVAVEAVELEFPWTLTTSGRKARFGRIDVSYTP